jgi:hypothetical protein
MGSGRARQPGGRDRAPRRPDRGHQRASQRRPPDRLESPYRHAAAAGTKRLRRPPGDAGRAARDRYRLLPPGHRLVSALSLLDTWYDDHEPGDDTPARHPVGTRRGTRTTAAGPGAASARPQPDRPGHPGPGSRRALPERPCRRGASPCNGPDEFPVAVVAAVPAPLLANSLHQHQAAAVLGLTAGVYPDRGLRAGIPHENQDLRQVGHQP